MSRSSRRLFHYTYGMHLPSILSDGQIKVATAGVPPGELPVAWFTFNPKWEPTCNGAIFDPHTQEVTKQSQAETEANVGGLVRIEVRPEAARFNWHEFKMLSGIAPAMARGLAETARQDGSNPADWRASFEPVPESEWLAVEVLRDGKWIPVDDSMEFTPEDVLCPTTHLAFVEWPDELIGVADAEAV